MNTPTTTDYPKQREHINNYIAKLATKQPEAMKAFTQLHKAASSPDVLETKTKELIALAIAVAARCDGCISYHVHDALKAGATKEEIMETLSVAILMGGGPSLMYAAHVIEAVEQFINANSKT